MSDAERWRSVLSLGRRAATDAAASAEVAALAASPDFYPRRLAVMASYGSGEPDVILSALMGPSRALASLALKAAVRFLGDETLAAALPNLPHSRRRPLARACADKRPNIIESAFPRLSAKDQSKLVAYAGRDFTATQLTDEDFADRLAPEDWSRIARRHPGPAIKAIAMRLDAEVEPSRLMLTKLNGVISSAGQASPREALALLQAAAARTPLCNLSYQRLALHFPAEVAALILADGKEREAILRKVDGATLSALLRQRGRGASGRELRRLSPTARRSLYENGIFEPMRNDAGALPADVVARLPMEARHTEARRAWSAAQYRARPELRLPYLTFLPFGEALDQARPYIADPEGDVRAVACAALIGAGRYEPAHLAEILALVQSRRNEQDPVRLAMLSALARLPPTRWRDEHLPMISDIVGAAISARDASAATLDSAARLLIPMAPARIGFVGKELTRVAEKLGRVPHINLEERLSDAQMSALAADILPLLETWRGRSQTLAITGFLGNFGRRLKASPALIDLLVRMTKDPRGLVAGQALETLVQARALKRLKTLIPELLRQDPSWITFGPVAPWINRHRQDLLTEFLKPRVYRGRFMSHGTAMLASFDGGYHRWTDRQQKTYARSLVAVAESKRRSLWELRAALVKIASMPAADAQPIAAMAKLEAKNPLLRDTALITLGRLDGARGARSLIEALDDDRGRIAIYALRKSVLDMPAADAIAFLRSAPLTKVTVAKEIVRLAGDVAGEPAWRFLAEFIDRSELHKDVRIAVLRALWSYLEREAVWEVFARLASKDPAAARSTVHIPSDRLSQAARGRLARHMALLLRNESAVVRLETAKRLAASPIPSAGASLAADLEALLEDATEEDARYVATALTLCVPLEATGELARRFADTRKSRVLQATITALVTLNPRHPRRVEQVSLQLIDLLLDKRRQITLAVRLAVQVLPADALETVILRTSAQGLLHPGASMEAVSGLRLRRGDDLGEFEARLACAEDSAARRIGLAVLTAQAIKLGWTRDARAKLEAYRADGAMVVSEAAELIFPPDSLKGD